MQQNPQVAIIGAGAMGGVMAGALSRAGVALTIIDTDAVHVEALARDGLTVANFAMDRPHPVPAVTTSTATGWADCALVMTPAYETEAAAETAARILKPEGWAVSCHNGLGNA
ncbi:MAG: 2-dehydropantoate 2-reductase N-terminal domain-containing protein, partial [Pseudomonadota bacterium]